MRLLKLCILLLSLELSIAKAKTCFSVIAQRHSDSRFSLEYNTTYQFGMDDFKQKAKRLGDLEKRDQQTVNKLIEKSMDSKLSRRFAARRKDEAPNSTVEVGIIALTTKDGARIEFTHTSSHPKLIEPEHFNKSYYEGLKNTGYTAADIVDFKYFHTHPPLSERSFSQLSYFDHVGLLDIKNYFKEKEIEIPINMYAVEPFRDQGQPVIWSFVE